MRSWRRMLLPRTWRTCKFGDLKSRARNSLQLRSAALRPESLNANAAAPESVWQCFLFSPLCRCVPLCSFLFGFGPSFGDYASVRLLAGAVGTRLSETNIVNEFEWYAARQRQRTKAPFFNLSFVRFTQQERCSQNIRDLWKVKRQLLKLFWYIQFIVHTTCYVPFAYIINQATFHGIPMKLISVRAFLRVKIFCICTLYKESLPTKFFFIEGIDVQAETEALFW